MKMIVASSAVFAALVMVFGGVNVAQAQTCQPLCGTQPQTLTGKKCADQTIVSQPEMACCDDLKTIQDCPGQRKCRSVTFDTVFGCSLEGSDGHCIQPAVTMDMQLILHIDSRPGSCCSQCSCAGDPHCYAFSGASEDFIMCDARDVKKGCAQTQALCLTQLDQLGDQCQWSSGSCQKSALTAIPVVLFFQKNQDSVIFNLGDRGIISQIIIKQGANVISLSAADCKANHKTPWVGTPIGPLTSQNYGKVWTYPLVSSLAVVRVDCVYSGSVVSSAHLDVQITAQGAAPGTVPSGVTGFCATGEFDMGKATHDISDAIHSGNLCGKSPVLATAQYFNNGKKVTKSNLKKVVKKFCKKYESGSGIKKVDKALMKTCYKNIMSKGGLGWDTVYCAANTLVTKDPTQCNSGLGSSIDCQTCRTDVQDYGWQYVINKWDIIKNSASGQGPTCLKIDQLPPDLTECQRGIRIQYLDPTTNEWTTYKAVPQGYTLCEDSGTFNSVDDPVLFQNKIRVTECGLELVPPGTCPDSADQLCDAEDGWNVEMVTTVKPHVSEFGVIALVAAKQLICNPALYPPPNQQACFNEPINPCPSCTGTCKSSGYVSPCGSADQDKCGTCLDPFAFAVADESDEM